MVKADIVTCRNCKKKIDKTKAYSEKKGQYFCDADCFNEYNAPKEACYICKKVNKTSHMTHYLGHWFCKDCLSTWLNSEEGQRDSFLDYVWNLYDPSVRTTPRYMTIRKQAEYYHKEYGLKYKGMLLAVKYHVETLEKMWHNEYGLGQVLPKTYFELKELWEQQAKLKQTVTEDNIHKEEKVMIGRRSPVRRGMLSLD